MTQDPYQTYPTFGAYTGLTNPFSSPYAAMQASAINPAAPYNPLAAQTLGAQGIQGIPGGSNYGGVTAQQLQLAAALASQAALPQLLGLAPIANGWAMQNPLVQAALQIQNPLLNPILAQLAFGSQWQQPYQQHHQHQMGYGVPAFGPQISPFPQFNSQLAPQSWVGQGVAGQMGQIGGGQGYGQVNPLLAQLAARAFQGTTPWTAF